ncbi:Na(+)-translocating NADH-quinone reductase subunit F [Flavobacteriaceae bacterium]|nr:Na(+)-translocating NADH-quinone reductase subunit F [Flavobacteriaceae bacterium]MDC1285567.1 Na(+)-translocating NADH-quinone reductase subunit F [Flavobacteriaceae bacterium]
MTMEMIKKQELHNLAMEVVGKRMEEDGFEFMTVNSELQKDPQFVCLKDKKLHFVIVRAVSYPDNPLDYDKVLMETVRSHAEKFEAKTYYAGVGLAHAENYELPLTTKDPYAINFQGLQKIESNA